MIEKIIKIAKGDGPADLLLKNGKLVNVISGEIYETSVAVYNGRIIGFGDYDAKEIVDLNGKYICPGFIDAHVHLESSMVTASEFSRAVVPRGTTCVIADPHEIANVLGVDGIKYIREASMDLPLKVFIMLPSCVPATHMETSGAGLTAEDLVMLFNYPRIIGLGEMMNFPGVIHRDPEVMAKLEIAGKKPIDGHAPGLTGKDLFAYIAAGIGSDHECTTKKEALEKLRSGMQIMIREGSTAKNLLNLLPVVTKENAHRCSFCTDDRHPADLIEEGHINSMIKTAINYGIEPITAIQMSTINTARYFGLKRTGAIIPGYHADIVIFDDFKNFNILEVYQGGKKVAENGQYLNEAKKDHLMPLRGTVNINWLGLNMNVPFTQDIKSTRARVIGIVNDQIVTKSLIEDLTIKDGFAVSDTKKDLLKMAVIERHIGSGNTGIAFVKGLGLKEGAIASSVTHDSHNIIVIGTNDEDMIAAVIEVARMQGGQVVISNGKVLASLPLPIGGLMSNLPLEEAKERIESMTEEAHKLGCTLKDPMMTLSFLALPVIPELKLTDKGLVDVTKFEIVPLFLE